MLRGLPVLVRYSISSEGSQKSDLISTAGNFLWGLDQPRNPHSRSLHRDNDACSIMVCLRWCMTMHWRKHNKINLCTIFLHDTIASNWRKALLIIIITKLIMSATNKQLNWQGTTEVKVSHVYQPVTAWAVTAHRKAVALLFASN